ncbi:hypothetical protein MHBO_002491 [Bonamia ostreae]|uniref:Uncharacterized protein n=1 Tax=Bonamia ostreae TaxID=126728 RepID=A0ABV2AMJ5_9EUKA
MPPFLKLLLLLFLRPKNGECTFENTETQFNVYNVSNFYEKITDESFSIKNGLSIFVNCAKNILYEQIISIGYVILYCDETSLVSQWDYDKTNANYHCDNILPGTKMVMCAISDSSQIYYPHIQSAHKYLPNGLKTSATCKGQEWYTFNVQCMEGENVYTDKNSNLLKYDQICTDLVNCCDPLLVPLPLVPSTYEKTPSSKSLEITCFYDQKKYVLDCENKQFEYGDNQTAVTQDFAYSICGDPELQCDTANVAAPIKVKDGDQKLNNGTKTKAYCSNGASDTEFNLLCENTFWYIEDEESNKVTYINVTDESAKSYCNGAINDKKIAFLVLVLNFVLFLSI